jgi:hypothetical protein
MALLNELTQPLRLARNEVVSRTPFRWLKGAKYNIRNLGTAMAVSTLCDGSVRNATIIFG